MRRRLKVPRCIVPVSGGKDSQVCMALAVMEFGAENVIGVHQHTGFDHPLTYAHMKYMEVRYGVKIVDTKSDKVQGLIDLATSKKVIFGRNARLCTRVLKLDPWFKYLKALPDLDRVTVFLGMRSAESPGRRDRYGALSSNELFTMQDINPDCPKAVRGLKVRMRIVDWTTPEVFAFLRDRGDRINPLYSKGHKRVGCYPCWLAGPTEFRLAARDPAGREHLEQIHKVVMLVKEAKPGIDWDSQFPHDIPTLLSRERIQDSDPFGFSKIAGPPAEDDDADTSGCSWCGI